MELGGATSQALLVTRGKRMLSTSPGPRIDGLALNGSPPFEGEPIRSLGPYLRKPSRDAYILPSLNRGQLAFAALTLDVQICRGALPLNPIKQWASFDATYLPLRPRRRGL